MAISKKKRMTKANRLALFEEAIQKEAANWYRIEKLNKYQYAMEYSPYEGVVVQAYPTTLRLVTYDQQTITCFSIDDLIRKAKKYSLHRDEYEE